MNFRLRDWLLSRQRFWGAPIPIIHCPACGEVPVPDDQLPVVLPDLQRRRPEAEGHARRWRRPRSGSTSTARSCGGPAKRDSDTMDTFVDSSWYFLRYCSPHYTDGPFDPEAVRSWMPADQYVGGVEHAILHLLYSRFFTKVLHDMGMVDFVEPFTALLNQGQVINQGKGMSKSLGNGVNLGEQIDAVRRGRGPADHGVRRPARGRHRLGRPVARRLAEVPAAGLAAERRRHLGARHADPTAATCRAAQGDPQDRARGRAADRVATASTCWSPGSWSWST